MKSVWLTIHNLNLELNIHQEKKSSAYKNLLKYQVDDRSIIREGHVWPRAARAHDRAS